MLQLSYQPLGGSDPTAYNLGVAVLLVSTGSHNGSLVAHRSAIDPRHHRLRRLLRLGRLARIAHYEVDKVSYCGRSYCHPRQ